MSPREYRPAVTRSDRPEIGPELLRATQDYLRLRCDEDFCISQDLVDAWDHFHEVCAPLIGRAVGAHRLSNADRNDCVQEVWKEIIAKLGQFRHDPARGQLRTWISTLARNKAVDVVRRRVRHRQEGLGALAERTLASRDSDPADVYERRCTQAQVREALDVLARRVSDSSYRVLHLRWFEGRTVPEIAEALGLTPRQVRFRHHRVTRQLRRLMARLQPGVAPGREPKKSAAARNVPAATASLS